MSGRSVPEIIDSLGVSALAREFGQVNITTVSSWKQRQSIPLQYWPTIIAFAGRHGVELSNDDLVAAHLGREERHLPAESDT